MVILKDNKDFSGFADSKVLFKEYEQGQSLKDSIVFNSVFLGVVAVVFVLCIATA